MKIISTNLAKPRTIEWQGKTIETGIYKYPTNAPIYLGDEDVKGDTVVNREHHGGILQACYLLSTSCYDHFKPLYPELEWDYGMFGENLTVEGLDDSKIHVGNIYNVGEATVEITKPRRPCYKFGVKFGNQMVIRQFIDFAQAGPYVKILKNGFVKSGDVFELVEEHPENPTIQEVYLFKYRK